MEKLKWEFPTKKTCQLFDIYVNFWFVYFIRVSVFFKTIQSWSAFLYAFLSFEYEYDISLQIQVHIQCNLFGLCTKKRESKTHWIAMQTMESNWFTSAKPPEKCTIPTKQVINLVHRIQSILHWHKEYLTLGICL